MMVVVLMREVVGVEGWPGTGARSYTLNCMFGPRAPLKCMPIDPPP